MTAFATKPPTYRLRLRAIDPDHDADDVRHLRMVLKFLLRRLRLRVVEIEREQAQTEETLSCR
jgi:hypothetical protein